MRAITFWALGLLASACAVTASPAGRLPPAARNALTDEVILNRAVLLDAAIDVMALVAIAPPASPAEWDKQARALGGCLITCSPEIGYIRVRLPVEKLADFARLDGITAYRVDGSARSTQNVAIPARPAVVPVPEPTEIGPRLNLASLPAESPLSAAVSVGAPEFLRQHPTFDGRGVGVFIAEGTGFPHHPSLNRARDRQGGEIAKLAGVVVIPAVDAVGDPALRPLPTLLEQREQEVAPVKITTDASGRFRHRGRSCVAPAAGAYWIIEHLPRNGIFPLDYRVLVLWKEGERRAWVDYHGDGDFRRVRPLRDFNDSGEFGFLDRTVDSGPATPGLQPNSFFVVFDPKSGWPWFGAEGGGGHATAVASYVAGHEFGGGGIGSAAPSARIVYSFSGDRSYRVSRILESLIEAAKRPDVDILQAAISLNTFEKGESFDDLVMDRVIDRWQKPLFWSSGNSSAGVDSAEGGTSRLSAGVGGYVSRETLRALAGYEHLTKADYPLYSRGPTRIGLMKPDFLAPCIGLVPTAFGMTAGDIDHMPTALQPRPPPGYFVSSGTSCASPVAAAVCASLVSAAKQQGLPHEAARLLWAMKAGARFLPDWPANGQGAGLIELPAAWERFHRSAAWPLWRVAPQIEVSAPIAHRWQQILQQPPEGAGLYEREGWTAGQSACRTIKLTRRAGPKETLRYRLAWLGNKGTFSLDSKEARIDLPLDQEREVTVSISPASTGLHSAHLTLVDDTTGEPVHWISFAIVAAASLDAGREFSAEIRGSRGILESVSMPVSVPGGTRALRVEVTSEGGAFNLLTGSGPLQPEASVPANSMTTPTTLFSPDYFQKNARGVRLMAQPAAGVWEFVALDGKAAHIEKLPETLNRHMVKWTALAAGVDASIVPGEGPQTRVRLKLQNLMGKLEGARAAVEIGASRTSEHTAPGDGQPAVVPFTVEPFTQTLVLSAKAAGTALKLYVYRRGPEQQDQLLAIPLEATNRFQMRRPKPGNWCVVVRSDIGEAWDGAFTLEQIATFPSLGSVKNSSPANARVIGDTWEETVELTWRKDLLPAGFDPVALVEVRDEAGEKTERANSPDTVAQRPVALGWTVLPLPRAK